MYWVLCNTTSAMGPSTEARGATPVCKSVTTSPTGQSASPASFLALSEGAYQFCIGIRPPARSSGLLPPSASRAEWQAEQWPRPRTR